MIKLSNAVSARIKGDDYQAYMFWIKACQLFNPDTRIDKIIYEDDQAKAWDDVVIHYKTPEIDTYGDPVYTDYHQIKYHVTQGGSIGWENLLDPKFINATSVSFLQRLHTAQKQLAPDGKGCRFNLVSPWQIHPDDPLAKIVNTQEGELQWNKLSPGGDKSQMGRIRKAMRDHLGLTSDDDLKVVLRPLRIVHNSNNVKQINELLNANLRASGLKPVDPSKIGNPYIDLIKGLLIKGINVFTKDILMDICKREELWVGNVLNETPAIPIGIRSFKRGTGNMEQDTKHMLCLLEHFEERNIKDKSAWNNPIVAKIEQFIASSTKEQVPYHIHLDAHYSISFAAGYFLDSKSGVDVAPIQKFDGLQVWKPDKKVKYEDYPGWIHEEHLRNEDNNDLVITLGVRHSTIDDVNYYLEQVGIPVRRVINCTIEGGPGGAVIENGDHAWVLADKITSYINERPFKERLGHIHIFPAVPNALIFFIGQFARAFGPCTLYEYDFEKRTPGGYEPAITLPPKKKG